ncbi:maleylpyruvate isomerase family mycothiol-dependent enzyme [Aeromicrobium wangtongii]|uniref:maleylpyruvate isomerase family mycothiol-dependent enzyme n=1 Tax=Aeromicrobium wangtongii TaxID=2969247 RepID=UPI0020178221|nr:maleylpyruvate isomerase family mycothiol-dependent enzyme [Aeromicrobium wangtongii]MCL3818152.1 maleylpyruvate isomerase family mycothiol-dependent enzyme [Aeromicrobium wangtongii]
MTPDQAWSTLAAERRAFADLLDGLEPEQWAAQSLCDAWTVREVAAHMMVGPAGSMGGFLVAMVRARGRFAVANRLLAARRAERPTRALAEDFRRLADSRFTPPGLDWHAPLTDFLVHRLDVTVPLGLLAGPAPAAWEESLEFLVGKQAERSFVGRAVPPLGYRATDVDWAHGDGHVVSGPAEVLALALTGRPHRLDELSGVGADALRQWVTAG